MEIIAYSSIGNFIESSRAFKICAEISSVNIQYAGGELIKTTTQYCSRTLT